MDVSDPERIWLEPECCASPETGRVWCQDKVWPTGECNAEPTEYVLAAALTASEAAGLESEAENGELRIAVAAAEIREDRLRAMIAGWADGNVPMMQALQREADEIRAALRAARGL